MMPPTLLPQPSFTPQMQRELLFNTLNLEGGLRGQPPPVADLLQNLGLNGGNVQDAGPPGVGFPPPRGGTRDAWGPGGPDGEAGAEGGSG
jgi:hypothetical protein